MKPNIFDLATKELTQDAFINWLLLWADPSNKVYDKDLYECAQLFVQSLVSSQLSNVGEIIKVDAGRQWNNIDIWAEVFTEDKNYFIIIEDKVFAAEHSNQLFEYKQLAKEYSQNNNFSLVCIYLKTGNEAEKILNEVRSKGYATFTRFHLIEIMDKFGGIKNDIFIDFRDRLIKLEASYLAFENTVISLWNDACWIGFYQFLEKEITLNLWHYVNPPSGNGFWNASLNWEDWDGFPVYLQIEQGKLCFKIATGDDVYFEGEFDRNRKRNEWNSIIISNAKELGYYEIIKPDKFGSGTYMTCAIVKQEDWLGNKDLVINKQEVVENLKKYKSFLKECLLTH